ncbi:MAG TPA: DUF4173 domain-containing protein [Verrucomicrobiae bacterium]|nr:DUF4173 domain-containing protein [Verrucomicrobiae bacterium]
MKRRAPLIAAVSFLLGLVFDWLFYGRVPGISVALYASLILGLTFYFAERFKKPLDLAIAWLTPVVAFFSLMVFVRANALLTVINIFIVMYLLLVVARLAYLPDQGLRQYTISRYLGLMFSLPRNFMSEAWRFLLGLAASRTASKPKSAAAPIIRGLLLSVPILALFMILLSSADLVFKQYIGSLFNPSVSAETIFRWGLIGFVTSLFAGAYALIFMPTDKPQIPTPAKKSPGLGAMESSIILGSVSTLFLVFVVVQLAYLFGGSDHIASTGYTYAEYARKGFFELIAVAAISFALILTIKRATALRTKSQNLTFKWLSSVLAAEVTVIMLSAHMRLGLYEETYGFTTLRLLSHLFVVWLAAAFGLLVFHIIRSNSNNHFAFQLFISILCFFALINIVNPDAFIARQNINRFNDTGKLDLRYLSTLSEDALPTTSQLLNNQNKDVQNSTANILYRQQRSADRQANDWQSANAARWRADKIFRDNAAQIEAGKVYIKYPDLDGTQE